MEPQKELHVEFDGLALQCTNASVDALRKGPIMLDDKKILELVATNKEKMAIKVPSPKTAIIQFQEAPAEKRCVFWLLLYFHVRTQK